MWAEVQDHGRGRLDRTWQSEPGQNLLFSLVLRPVCTLREAPLLTLGAAAGLAEALDLRVKWPNDLVTSEGQKVGGLLGEVEGDLAFVVLGVGLNVNQTVFPGLPNATSLATLRGPQNRAGVLDLCVRAILAWSMHRERLDLWRRRSHTLGTHVRIGEVEGLATAIRDDGALIVGGRAVSTGELS